MNFIASQGQAYLPNFMITGHPEKSYILRIQNSELLSFYERLKANLTKKDFEEYSSAYLQVNLRKCIPGEILIKLENTETCYRCRNTKYSLNLLDASCHNCPKGANCLGGSSIFVHPGTIIYSLEF